MGGAAPRYCSVAVTRRKGGGFNYSFGDGPEGEELVAVIEYMVKWTGRFELGNIETLCAIKIKSFAPGHDKDTVSLFSVRDCIEKYIAAEKDAAKTRVPAK